MRADYCAECAKAGVIATKSGPTCTHSEKSGVNWWPADFSAMDEQRRVEWIWANRTKTK